MLSLPPKLRSRGNEGRGECDGAVGGKKNWSYVASRLKRKKRANRGTFRQSSQIALSTHKHRFGEGEEWAWKEGSGKQLDSPNGSTPGIRE